MRQHRICLGADVRVLAPEIDDGAAACGLHGAHADLGRVVELGVPVVRRIHQGVGCLDAAQRRVWCHVFRQLSAGIAGRALIADAHRGLAGATNRCLAVAASSLTPSAVELVVSCALAASKRRKQRALRVVPGLLVHCGQLRADRMYA